MITLSKKQDVDFTILNLTDPQLTDSEWEVGHKNRQILEYTVDELVKRVQPDLITISGDITFAGNDKAYDMFAQFINSYGIPWSVVWGNHDNQNGDEYVKGIVQRYMEYEGFVYESGDAKLGNGNFIIKIEENGAPVSALIMMDSHDREPFTDEEGNTELKWARLIPEQRVWLKETANELKSEGYNDATLIMHIPIFEYTKASEAAYKKNIDLKDISVEDANGVECWNDGYTDSIGVQHEDISCYPKDDGILNEIKSTDIVKRLVCGHDHISNWMIKYDDIDLIFSLKTGAGCYWEPDISGGTVIKINKSGVYKIHHEYVNAL